MAHHISTKSELDALFSSTTYVAVDFYADWCPPCKMISPIFEQHASAKAHLSTELAFAKVNTDHVKELAAQYSITGLPTFMFFKEGKQVAVHGKKMLQGADVQGLNAAVEKLGALAEGRIKA